MDEWDDEPRFNYYNRNFLVEEFGNIEALISKRLLVPKSLITEESHCDYRFADGAHYDEKTGAEMNSKTKLRNEELFGSVAFQKAQPEHSLTHHKNKNDIEESSSSEDWPFPARIFLLEK